MWRSRGLLFAFIVAAGCGGAREEAPLVRAETVPTVEAPAVELLPNAVSPEEGVLAGGQPSLEQLAALREAGYATVINLRTEAEGGTERGDVEALGMSYATLPISGAEGLSSENALAFAAIFDAAERPVVVHCASGNRVGALFALKAFYADGASPEEALTIGLDAGMTRLEAPVREHLAAASASGPQ